MSTSQDALERIDQDADRYLEELVEYLKIPSISTDPEYAPEVRRCADFVRDQLAEVGIDAKLIETDGHPLVYGERIEDPSLPTVLFYGHYDVQPVDPLEEWDSPPFEPTRKDDLLVARGATDDKGQSFSHLKAVDALLKSRGRLPVNVKFLIEGEEESGGESIEAFVREDAGKTLDCDVVFISDSSMFGPGQPSILYGLKGLAYFEIKVSGPNRDLHSGSFGGAVANPLNVLSQLLGGLRDPSTGEIQIPGFYDDVDSPHEWERKAIADLPFDSEDFQDDLGVSELWGEEGYSTLERVWTRPTCDVHGLWGGYQGAGAKTVLPSFAGAKVSMRLVPNQSPEKIAEGFRRYFEENKPDGVRVEIEAHSGANPVLIDVSGPFFEAASQALEATWGKKPYSVREGGTIPIVGTFHEVLERPVLLVGLGLSDDRLHAPNEKFNVSHFYQGIRTTARFLDLAAELRSSDS